MCMIINFLTLSSKFQVQRRPFPFLLLIKPQFTCHDKKKRTGGKYKSDKNEAFKWHSRLRQEHILTERQRVVPQLQLHPIPISSNSASHNVWSRKFAPVPTRILENGTDLNRVRNPNQLITTWTVTKP